MLSANPERVQEDILTIKTNGSPEERRILIVAIPGLLKKTGHQAISFEEQDGVPVIYIDSKHFYEERLRTQEKRKIAKREPEERGRAAGADAGDVDVPGAANMAKEEAKIPPVHVATFFDLLTRKYKGQAVPLSVLSSEVIIKSRGKAKPVARARAQTYLNMLFKATLVRREGSTEDPCYAAAITDEALAKEIYARLSGLPSRTVTYQVEQVTRDIIEKADKPVPVPKQEPAINTAIEYILRSIREAGTDLDVYAMHRDFLATANQAPERFARRLAELAVEEPAYRYRVGIVVGALVDVQGFVYLVAQALEAYGFKLRYKNINNLLVYEIYQDEGTAVAKPERKAVRTTASPKEALKIFSQLKVDDKVILILDDGLEVPGTVKSKEGSVMMVSNDITGKSLGFTAYSFELGLLRPFTEEDRKSQIADLKKDREELSALMGQIDSALKDGSIAPGTFHYVNMKYMLEALRLRDYDVSVGEFSASSARFIESARSSLNRAREHTAALNAEIKERLLVVAEQLEKYERVVAKMSDKELAQRVDNILDVAPGTRPSFWIGYVTRHAPYHNILSFYRRAGSLNERMRNSAMCMVMLDKQTELARDIYLAFITLPYDLLKEISESDSLMADALNRYKGIMLDSPRILLGPGLFVPVKGNPGHYRFSDMMMSEDADADYTRTLINAIIGEIAKCPAGALSEAIKMVILHQINMQSTVPENKVLWHIIEKDVIPEEQQQDSFVTKVNKAFRDSKAAERIWILDDKKTAADAIAEIRKDDPDAVIDVALGDEGSIASMPDDKRIKMLVFKARNFIQLEGVIAALRALHSDNALPTLLRIYSVMAGEPFKNPPDAISDDPKDTARRIIFNLSKPAAVHIDDIPKLNERLLELLTAA